MNKNLGLPLSARPYDHDAIKAAYEAGVAVHKIAADFSVSEKSIRHMASRRKWDRPVRTYDLATMKTAYEAGVSMDAIAAQCVCARATIRRLAGENNWVRPDYDKNATIESMRRAYEGGASLKDMAFDYRYSLSTIKSMIATHGWRRHADTYEAEEPEQRPRIDPLAEALKRAGYAMHVAGPSKPARASAPVWVR